MRLALVFLSALFTGGNWALGFRDDGAPGLLVSYEDGTPIEGLAESRNSSVPIDPLIIHGQFAAKGETPYMVSIQAVSGGKNYHFCGGSLIATNKVLTAAHCIGELDYGPFKVGLGYYQLSLGTSNPGSQLIAVKSGVAHPKYRPGQGTPDDIAVLTLASHAKLSSTVKLVRVSSYDPHRLDRQTVTVTGWGYVKPEPGPVQPDILQTSTQHVVNHHECARAWRAKLKWEHVCTKSRSSATCRGDSGGPLMYRGEQIGIVSFGIEGCKINFPEVYAAPYYYSNWIYSN